MVRDIGPARWLVQKLLPEGHGGLYGPSGSLKLYLGGEGRQGFAKCIAAWCQARWQYGLRM